MIQGGMQVPTAAQRRRILTLNYKLAFEKIAPFKSEAQRRLFYAKARRGEISQATVEKWERHTPKDKKLPERVKSASFNAGLEIPALSGLLFGLPTGRAVAGHTAAMVAPYGRKTRSEDIAARLAYVGAPLGGILAMYLARKKNLLPAAQRLLSQKFPRGMITDPRQEAEILELALPFALGLAGSAAGGATTGLAVGAFQRLRGEPSRKKTAAKTACPERPL